MLFRYRFIITFFSMLLVLGTTVAQDDPASDLTETLQFTDFGFSIDYPAGWFTVTEPPVYIISQFESDATTDVSTVEGVKVTLDHRSLSFMQGIGLPVEATIDDLIDLNIGFFNWEMVESEDVQLFGVDARRTLFNDPFGNVLWAYQGFINDGIFLFELAVPSEDALNDFLPTWEAMLDSIQPLDDVISEGELITVNDIELYIDCRGEGTPTVIFEHAGGASSALWQQSGIHSAVAEVTRACVYDRANAGLSGVTPIDDRRTIENSVDELAMLLDNAEVEGPYVLVGHSVGGIFARVFADQYADAVTGVVLVDSAHPEQQERLAEVLEELGADTEDVSPLLGGDGSFENLDLPASIEIAQRVESIGDIPLIVITAGSSIAPEGPLTTDITEQLNEFWVDELQAELLDLSTNSMQILVEDANHISILETHAEVIVAAITELIVTISE